MPESVKYFKYVIMFKSFKNTEVGTVEKTIIICTRMIIFI